MEVPSLRRLHQLVTVGEYRSISDAATVLQMSASALSVSLKKLEASVGVTLLVRRPGEGVVLTPEGVLVTAKARELLDQADEVKASIAEAVAGPSTTIIVGSLVTVAPLVLPRMIAAFSASHPESKIGIHTGSQDVQIESLTNGVTHLALTYNIGLPSSIRFEPLLKAGPRVLLPADHRLAGRTSLRLKSLMDEPYVALDLPLSREYFFSLFMTEGLEKTPALMLTELDLVRSVVGNGLGWSLINMVPTRSIAPDGTELAHVRLATKHPPIWLGIATLKGRRLPTVVRAFAEVLRTEI